VQRAADDVLGRMADVMKNVTDQAHRLLLRVGSAWNQSILRFAMPSRRMRNRARKYEAARRSTPLLVRPQKSFF
jgi:hypothetical protein